MKKSMKSLVEEEEKDMVMVSQYDIMEDEANIESMAQRYEELLMKLESLAKEFEEFKWKQHQNNKCFCNFLKSKIDSYLETPKDVDIVTIGVEEIFHLM